MSTTIDAETTEQDQTQVDTADQREAQIEQRATMLYRTLQKAEAKKPPEQRTKNAILWTSARREAARQLRRERARATAKRVAKNTAATAYTEARSAATRNRAQLVPWKLAAGYAAVGETVWLAGTYGGDVNPAGMVATTLVVTAGVSLAVWKRRLATRVPSRFAPKTQLGLGAGCVWAAGMALVPPQLPMLLVSLLVTCWLGLSWWRQHDHPIPLAADVASIDLDTQRPVKVEPGSQAQRRINGILHAWNSRTALRTVAGSVLSHLGSADWMDTYVIQLDVDGQVTINQVRAALDTIGMQLGVFPERLKVESGAGPDKVILRHLHADPTFNYEGPLVLCDGKPIQSRWEVTPGSNVDIVFGTYLDGQDYATYRLISQGSVNSAFLLGGMGSGKTRTAEIIGVALRMLGCYVLWLDGQGGASSPVLNQHADRAFEFDMHDRANDVGVREFTSALDAACRKRNADLKDRPELGGEYTYDPHRPPIVGLIDEAHEAFNTTHPTAGTYGDRLGAYGVQIRKCGVAMIALSQDYDKTSTFGGGPEAGRLRTALTVSRNLIAMRHTDNSRVGMLPSNCPRLETVPDTGYGYLPYQSRPDALWRTHALGKDKDESLATLHHWMGQYELATLEFDLDAAHTGQSAGQRRQAATGEHGAVVHFPGMSAAEPDAVDPTAAVLTETEQRVLSELQGSLHTPSTLATAWSITSQAAGRHLRNLAKKGVVVQLEDGRYMAKV